MRTEAGQRIRTRLARCLIVTIVAFAAGLLLPVGLSGAMAAPAPSTAPELSIAVDNGLTSVKKGDALSYTVTIRNLGTKKVAKLRVTQTMPPGMSFASADSHGTAKAGVIGWRLDIKAGAEITLHSKATVTSTPDTLLRLATVACASVSTKGPPLVCASHSDQLPAGAAAEASVAGSGAASSSFGTWLVALAGMVVLGAVATVLLVRRRHRSILA